jgi:hypothetical protein
MVINRILLHRFRSLPPTIISTCPPFPLSILRRPRLTGASIQALNCVSNAAHPAAVYPDDAQHAVIPSVSSQIQRGEGGGGKGRTSILSTELMSTRHGFASVWFGRRTRNLGRGGRRIGCSFEEAPFGGIFVRSPSLSLRSSDN